LKQSFINRKAFPPPSIKKKEEERRLVKNKLHCLKKTYLIEINGSITIFPDHSHHSCSHPNSRYMESTSL
jgi:hypothetical protein